MLSGGVRLALLVAAPLLAALVAHELRHRLRSATVVAVAAVGACAGLALSLAGGVSGGASVERTFGSAIPGVELTGRADSASIVIIVIACLAAMFALGRARASCEHLTGLLLSVAGIAVVAVAGNVVLLAAGVEVIAAGALLVGGRRGPGFRATVVVSCIITAAGLGLVAAAAQTIAQVGSSDLASIPPAAVGGAVAVPWALAGAILMVSSTVLVGAPGRPRDWPAIATAPAGFLVLLRLEQTVGGQVPGNAGVMLGVIGGLVALAGGWTALRATTVGVAGGSALCVLTGLLVSLGGGSLAANGVLMAGLFIGLELGLIAAASWGHRPTAWAVAAAALLALPGGATGAVVVVSLGSVAGRGPAAFAQLAVLVASAAAAAVGLARLLTVPSRTWRPVPAGAVMAVVAGVAGGLLPGAALRAVAGPLVVGAQRVDVDAAALQRAGADWAGGYFTAALLLVLGAGASALLLVAAERPARTSPPPATPAAPRLVLLLRLRRPARGWGRRALTALRVVDRWLDVQPGLTLVAVAALVGVLVLR